jgi:hypothetical protein
VKIEGRSTRAALDTPSRRKIFVCHPAGRAQARAQEEAWCTDDLSTLARRAYAVRGRPPT